VDVSVDVIVDVVVDGAVDVSATFVVDVDVDDKGGAHVGRRVGAVPWLGELLLPTRSVPRS
jgi:hypothetical protein